MCFFKFENAKMLFRIILNNVRAQTFFDYFQCYRLKLLETSVPKLNYPRLEGEGLMRSLRLEAD